MARPSATSNFAQSAIAVGRENEKILKATLENSPDYSKIVQEAAVRQGKENIAAMRAESKVSQAAVEEYAKNKTKKTVMDAEQDYKKDVRKAGVLASAGKLLGTGIGGLGKSDRKPRELGAYDSHFDKQEGRARAALSDADKALQDHINGSKTKPTSTGTGTGTGQSQSTTAAPTTLQGARKEFADAIAGPESGSWGYEAFNQGGAAGGTVVLGKSGSHKETFGRSLTDMTLGEIFEKQNLGGSDAEFQAAGGLHAVGRYQFIGPTLREEVDQMGLSHDTKFVPQVQDDIFFSHAKRMGDISPWIGPSVNYGAEKRSHLNSLIPQL